MSLLFIRLKKLLVASLLILPADVAFAQAPPSPITNVQQIVDLFDRILFWFSSIFWIASGIATIYAGFLYLTAAGNDQQVEKAKKQLLYAVIAIAIGLIGPGLSTLVNAFLKGS